MGKRGEAERHQEIRDAVRDLLDDDDSVVVSRRDGEVHVRAAGENGKVVSPLARSHPEVYARLVRTSARIDDAGGCSVTGFWIVTAIAVVVTLDVLDVAPTWDMKWAIVAIFVGFWIGTMSNGLLERLAYRRDRDDLLEAVRRSGLSAADLFAAVHGDKDIEEAAKRLKLEREEAF